MSRSMEIDIVPEHASIRTARSRMPITATIRQKTSRLFGHDSTAIPDNSPRSIQGPPLRTKRSWFNSVGARFARQDRFALDSQESSQDAEVEIRKKARTTSTSSPSSGDSQPRSSTRRRLFSGLHSLPAKFRRGGAALFGRSSSSSLSDERREHMPMLTVSTARLPDMGSLSSFRMGVQKALREIVDDNFRFSDDNGMRSVSPTRPPPRVPLRTLWTIMSDDSSDSYRGQGGSGVSTYEVLPKSLPKSWSPPNWSPSYPDLTTRSSTSDGESTDAALTESEPCSPCSATSTTSTILCPAGQNPSDGYGSPCESLQEVESMSPVLPEVLRKVLVLQEVQNMPESRAERSESRAEPVNRLQKEDIRPTARGMEPIPLL